MVIFGNAISKPTGFCHEHYQLGAGHNDSYRDNEIPIDNNRSLGLTQYFVFKDLALDSSNEQLDR